MKKFYFVALVICFGCLSEKNLDPASPRTFVKYYNGGYNDEAQDIKQTSDGGFILLATTVARDTEVDAARFKIKLVKTDEFGTVQWQRVYPGYEDQIDSVSFRGRSIQVLKDGAGTDNGYVIVGDSIQKEVNAQSHLRIMVTDLDGNITGKRNIKPGFGVHGNAVAVNTNGNYLVLGSAENPQALENMFLAEFSPTLVKLWERSLGAGQTSLANRLFIDAQQFLIWSGTVIRTNRSDIRLIRVPHDSQNTFFDREYGTPATNETGRDICQYGFGFAVIGSTNETAAGDEDILFKRLTQDGTELTSKAFGFPNQAENGLAICQAKDGGVILLGSVDSNTEVGRGLKDYYLIKINAFGDTEWERIFGSKSDDIGSSVLSLSDGGFLIYGTTEWGGLKTLTLIKTDSQGLIE